MAGYHIHSAEGMILHPDFFGVVRMILLMQEILHQLRLVVYPAIYRFFYIQTRTWCRISSIRSFIPYERHDHLGFMHVLDFPQSH